jgi:hypothetical protein
MKVPRIHINDSPRLPRGRALWMGVLAGAAIIVLVPVVGKGLQEKDPGFRYPSSITRVPDANAQNDINGADSKAKANEAANAERKKQITDDSALLLKLATDLKTEVDKTDKDTLSLTVIRKADEIEKLAHSVKERMKLTVGR